MTRIFLGTDGLRAGWRVLLFAGLFAILAAALAFITHSARNPIFGIDFPVIAVAAVGANLVAARMEGRSLFSFGFGGPDRLRNLAVGLVAGFAGLSVLMGLLMVTGAFVARGPDLHGREIARWALYWTVVFSFTALGEESLTRGYPLFTLSRGIGFWPAAVVLSLVFGAGHIGNRGEEVIGIVNAVLAGLMFAYSVWWTGTLWWAIGCHLSWDWGETFFYGVPNSGGGIAAHHFLSGSPAGAAWLSGGAVGPEGSVLAALALFLLGVTVRYTTRRNRVAGLNET